MPVRKAPFVTGEFYHVFNRGVAQQPIFHDTHDYRQAFLGLEFYRIANPPIKLSRFKILSQSDKNEFWSAQNKTKNTLIDITCFTLMPNHFHLLLQQTQDNGISRFVNCLTNSYTRYFNTRHERVGPLFQGVFKAVHVDTEEQLIHVSRYIHLNPVTSYLIKENQLFNYPWSSLGVYLNPSNSFINPQPILSNFKSPQTYQEFIINQIDYARRFKEIEHLTLENPRVQSGFHSRSGK